MLIGYARISKADGSQSLDLQRDALRDAGVIPSSWSCFTRPRLTSLTRSSISLIER